MRLTAALRLNALVALDRAQQGCLDSPEAVYQLLAPQFLGCPEERLLAVLLDTRYRLIKTVVISAGTVNESLAHPREVFKPAIAFSAYALALAHNHPSGCCDPSEADCRLTRRVAEAARLLQIGYWGATDPNAELGIMQSIFSGAARREGLCQASGGGSPRRCAKNGLD